jgi:hypothetical protein
MQSKPNHVDRASVFESSSPSAPGGFHTFALFPLPFYFSTKRTQLSCSSCKSCQKEDLLYLPKRPI